MVYFLVSYYPYRVTNHNIVEHDLDLEYEGYRSYNVPFRMRELQPAVRATGDTAAGPDDIPYSHKKLPTSHSAPVVNILVKTTIFFYKSPASLFHPPILYDPYLACLLYTSRCV